MKCPYCGGEMERGAVFAGAERIDWLPEGARAPLWQWSESPGIMLKPCQYVSRAKRIDAPRCKACRKIILDY